MQTGVQLRTRGLLADPAVPGTDPRHSIIRDARFRRLSLVRSARARFRECRAILNDNEVHPHEVRPHEVHPRRVPPNEARRHTVQRPQVRRNKAVARVADPKVDLLNQARADRPIDVKADRDDGIELTDSLSATSDGFTNRASLSAL